MNKYLLLLSLVAVIGCSSKSGYKYSQDVVAKERALSPYISSIEDKMAIYLPAGQYDSIVVMNEAMEKRVQEKIDEINAMPLPNAKGADEFKAAVLKYFTYMKSLYTGYKKLGNATTDEEREGNMTELRTLVGRKDVVLNEMQTAQKKYASDNDFKVENK